MKYIFTFLISLLLVSSVKSQLCTNDNRFTNEPYFTDAQISSQLNITYANAINWTGSNEILKMDVYYPTLAVDTLPLRPLILMVHGGGLISGDKINYTRVCKEFAKRGFVAATINYRLGLNCATDTISEEKAKYRAQQDINAAFRFVAQNAITLRVDTAWMFIGGGSAGSVASLGVVYISQAEWNVFTPGLQSLLGDLNNSGNNLTNTFSIKGIFNDWGAMLKESMQPTEMLPMVSFHGDADSTVAVDSSFGGGCIHVDKSYGSRAMHHLLITNGVCSDLSVRPGGGHGVYQDSIFGAPFRVGRAACFFKSLFCNNCSSFSQTDSVEASCSLSASMVNNITDSKFLIYPNPFVNKITISNLQGNETFRLINQLGQTIYHGQSIQTHDFSYLQNGVYFLTVETNNTTITSKLLKVSH
jgi:poly(3-hydroxybutyrate) depolymerase